MVSHTTRHRGKTTKLIARSSRELFVDNNFGYYKIGLGSLGLGALSGYFILYKWGRSVVLYIVR